MSAQGASRFPPARFSELSGAQAKWLRRFWFATVAFALLLDIAGTAYVLRDVYERDPVFHSVNLSSQIESDGAVSVETLIAGADGLPAVEEGSLLVAVNGDRLPVRADTASTIAALSAAEGERLVLTIAAPDGRVEDRNVTRSGEYRERMAAGSPIGLDARMAIRLGISLTTCLTLVFCAALLVLRRPRDPVCQLFSFSFLLFAATIDPPLIMWLGSGWGNLSDWISSLGWLCLVLGIAAFPDGRFEPHWLRWLVITAPLAAIALTFDQLGLATGAIIAFAAPLLLFGGIAMKYRRYPPGIERQQIKWAAFGFASGLISVAVAFTLAETDPLAGSEWAQVFNLLVVSLFSLGFLMLALGLLVALLRFRLWEADRVISRSAVYAIVAVLVAMIWAASMDLVKWAVESALGEENKALAGALGAVMAAGLFGPTQSIVLNWTKTRFNADGKRIDALIARMHAWRTTEGPEEIAARALGSVAAAVHAGSAALLVDTQFGRELLAARDLEDPQGLAAPGAEPAEDPRFVIHLPLEDEDGTVGLMLIGRRSDSNRYNEDELANLDRLREPLAETLRIALKRREQESSVQRMLGAVEERLSRLEGGGAGAQPA